MKKKRTVLWIVLGALVAVVAVGTVLIRSTFKKIENRLAQLTQMAVIDVDLSRVPDGTYSGSHEVFPVAAEVRVTVAGHKITGIELVKHRNGQGAAAEAIPARIVEAQTLQVDVVSGATYSSKVILKAVEKALNSAY